MRFSPCQYGRRRYSRHAPSPFHAKEQESFCVGPFPGCIQKSSPFPERFPRARKTTSCVGFAARSNVEL